MRVKKCQQKYNFDNQSPLIRMNLFQETVFKNKNIRLWSILQIKQKLSKPRKQLRTQNGVANPRSQIKSIITAKTIPNTIWLPQKRNANVLGEIFKLAKR